MEKHIRRQSGIEKRTQSMGFDLEKRMNCTASAAGLAVPRLDEGDVHVTPGVNIIPGGSEDCVRDNNNSDEDDRNTQR